MNIKDIEQDRITLGLLDSVERDGAQSQRRIAAELGIALGLTNAYINRCVKKGLLKATQAPARRYMYYLTPQGFAEKSRLTVEYLAYSFGFFREAKADCAAVFAAGRMRGYARVVLLGKSDLAEISVICAMESNVTIVAVVDAHEGEGQFAGLPLFSSVEDVKETFDAVMVTDLISTRQTSEAALARYGTDRVLIPALLRQRLRRRASATDQSSIDAASQ